MELKLNVEYNNLLELINQLPDKLKQQLKTDLNNSSPETPKANINAKEKLAALIKEMREEPMFTDIKDLVEWQKSLRNEWG